MKRPHGFDSGPAPTTDPAPPATAKKVRSRTANRRRPTTRPGNDIRTDRAELRASRRERRRFERREVRRFTRHSRHRRLVWIVSLTIVAGLVGLFAVAVYSPVLALRTISITGASKVSADDIREAIDGQIGTPLALLDYEAMRKQLDAFPVIRSFSSEIVPPSTLKLHIVERAPVGVAASASGFSVLDPAGVVLESSERRPEGLPLIDVASTDTESVAFTAVVDVLLSLPESIRSRVDLAQATSKDDVRLVLTGAGQRVRWGSADRSALKARVLEELMENQGDNANVEFDVSAPLSPVVRAG